MIRLAVVAALLCAPPAAAQAPARPWGPPLEASYRGVFVGAGRLREGGRDSGDATEYRQDWRVEGRVPAGDGRLTLGAFMRRTDLVVSSAELVPDTLQLYRAALGYEWKARDWRWAAQVAPSLGGDRYLDARSASVAGSLVATNETDPRRIWVVGLGIDPRGGFPVLPFFGAILKPDENWTVRLLLPEIGVARKTGLVLGGKTAAKAAFKLSGGGYRVSQSFGSARGRPELDGRWLREQTLSAELGEGVDWGQFRAELTAGWAFLRRFEYRDAGMRVTAAGAPVVGLTLGGRF